MTSGAIPTKIIKTTLSIGVGIAIALSMVRIVVPVKLWLPGSISLSWVKPCWIAYDAGGVWSKTRRLSAFLAEPPYTAIYRGFGIIAMVAMTPVLSIMILGMLFKRQEIIEKKTQVVEELEMGVVVDDEVEHDNVLVFVNRGYSERVVEIARSLVLRCAIMFAW